MAVMTDPQRFDTWADFMRELSSEREPIALTKVELRAAIDAVDLWISDNAASFNTAIPQPARGALTAAQKARMLMFVVRKRFSVGT
jgi:hypothetical protein